MGCVGIVMSMMRLHGMCGHSTSWDLLIKNMGCVILL